MQEILTQLGLEDIPPVKVPESLSRAIKEFLRSDKRFLVLYGPTGTFKTTAVKKSLKAYAKSKLLKNGKVSVYDCMFVRFVDLPNVWQEDEVSVYDCMFVRSVDPPNVWQEYEEVFYRTKLLAIDDLVLSGFPDSFWMNLFSLIDYRYTKNLKTIITTNHDLKCFLEGEVNFYQRIASRLCDKNLSMLVLSSAS
jgi:DNA replication protein DnaC